MFKRSRILLTLLALSLSLVDAAADDSAGKDSTKPKIDYIPKFHGVLRARYEADLQNGYQRFQLRNLRMTATGHVAPRIDYFIQVDFCDRGKMKFLDGWGRVGFTDQFAVQAGQFRIPFGEEPFKAPVNYVFSNRSFLGNQFMNVRAVGAKFIWSPRTPFMLEAGAFNTTSISEHDIWNRTLAYATKATLKVDHTTLSASFASLSPDSVRTNSADIAVGWHCGRWTAEAEGAYKHYTHRAHKDAWAYNMYGRYTMPVSLGQFNALSFHGRFDGITAHSSALRKSDGNIITDTPARNRLTAGITLTAAYLPVFADIRLDYEKFFYHHGFDPAKGQGDRLTLELVVRF
ncbi:MAG: hypothetical protein K2M04_08285 [Muribaculaceae bacterium]|nr:hypothetical protein [Muribaculaceae bacterium]